MSFLYPLGLIGLIGVPILIIIYIIKNKFTEQIVPSTFMWQLSERFLKKRRRPSILSGIISLILQILIIITISLLIAHPVITIANSAKEYCFILDGSGSMNMMVGEDSRMDIAKDRIVIDFGVTEGSVKLPIVILSEDLKSAKLAIWCEKSLQKEYDYLDYNLRYVESLKARGWNVVRLYAHDWIDNNVAEKKTLKSAIDKYVNN